MKERFKSKLTREVIQADYEKTKERKQSDREILIIGMIMMVIFLFVILMSASLVFAFLLIPIAVFLVFWWYVRERRAKMPSEEVRYQILETVAVSTRIRRDTEYDSYYVTFEKIGEVEVNDNQYHGCEIGDRYFALKILGTDLPLLYSMKNWRLEDVSEEQIAQEIREEEALIERLMACERFPKLTIRQKYYPDTKIQNYTEALKKSDEERNVFERLTANRFNFDRISSMEYMIRYCPPALLQEISREFSVGQRTLYNAVKRRIVEENKENKKEERKQKLKSIFTGRDQYE